MVQRAKRSERNTAKATDAAERTDTPARGERLSARTTWIVLGIILLAGLGLRLAYLTELRETPDFAAPLADAGFHDYWARGLATGDWTPPPSDPDPRIPEVPYLRPPGYPYVLAAAYELTGASYVGARIGQFGLGLINCVLAFLLARSLFGRLVGLVAAGLCATSWALIYFEGELQAPVLIITLILWMLLLLRKWLLDPRMLTALGSGLLLGALALVRANALLFIPVGALWIWWAGRKSKLTHRRALTHAAVFVISAAAAIAPATIRNAVVADEFVLISTNGPVNLYIGNNPIADGITAKIPNLEDLTGSSAWSWFSYPRIVEAVAEREGRPMGYGEVGSYFTGLAVEWITDHPGEFAKLTLRRALLFWARDEISNNKAIEVAKRDSIVLRYLPPFPVVLSLALTGVVLLIVDARRRSGAEAGGGLVNRTSMLGPTLVLVGSFILVYFLSFVPFLAAGRFRVPLIPLLVMFGAYAICRAAEMALRRGWPALSGTFVLWVVLLGLCWLPSTERLGGERFRVKAALDTAIWHTDRGVALMNDNETAAAILEFRTALDALPGYVDAHVQLARAYAARGDVEAAIRQLATVLRARPERDDLRRQLIGLLSRQAGTLLQNNQPQRALDPLRRALALSGGDAEIQTNIGIAYSRMGQPEAALREYAQALATDPNLTPAHYNRGLSLMKLNRFDEAIAAFQAALELEPQHVDAMVSIGNAYAQKGNSAEAIRWYRRGLEQNPNHIVALLNLAGSLAGTGELDEAEQHLLHVLELQPGNRAAIERLQRVREMKQSR
jgi:tetratricopeptide (TPR) repeat protein